MYSDLTKLKYIAYDEFTKQFLLIISFWYLLYAVFVGPYPPKG